MTVHRFETVLGAEGSGVFIEIPLDVPAVFGRARPAVRATVNGHPFRSTVAVYGGRYYLPVKRALREAAGVAAGDTRAHAAFAGLSYTHRREYVEWVAEAKRDETRRRRVEQAMAMLRDGRRHP